MSERIMLGESAVDPELSALLEEAKARGPMTAREKHEQKRSFLRAEMPDSMSDEEKDTLLDTVMETFCPECGCKNCRPR